MHNLCIPFFILIILTVDKKLKYNTILINRGALKG